MWFWKKKRQELARNDNNDEMKENWKNENVYSKKQQNKNKNMNNEKDGVRKDFLCSQPTGKCQKSTGHTAPQKKKKKFLPTHTDRVQWQEAKTMSRAHMLYDDKKLDLISNTTLNHAGVWNQGSYERFVEISHTQR